MKKLILTVALLGLFLTSSCTSMAKAGTWLCEREQTISAGITQGGDMLAGVVGPVATAGAWFITTLLDAGCKAFDVLMSVPEDLGNDAMKLNPFGGSDEAKPPIPPGR